MQNNPQPSSVSDFKKIKKPWGYEVVWAKSTSSPGYIGKLLYINAGHRLSLQYHREKEETIFVKSGILHIETVGRVIDVNNITDMLKGSRKIHKLLPGDTFHVSRFMSHRFIAGESDVELIEVSTKQLDDVVRIEDDYER